MMNKYLCTSVTKACIFNSLEQDWMSSVFNPLTSPLIFSLSLSLSCWRCSTNANAYAVGSSLLSPNFRTHTSTSNVRSQTSWTKTAISTHVDLKYINISNGFTNSLDTTTFLKFENHMKYITKECNLTTFLFESSNKSFCDIDSASTHITIGK